VFRILDKDVFGQCEIPVASCNGNRRNAARRPFEPDLDFTAIHYHLPLAAHRLTRRFVQLKKICDLIDVSKHQGIMPWPTVKSTGVSHAMLRAGFGRYSSQRDPQFDRNVQECERIGIAWGAYWYSYATGVAEARKEARVFLAIIAEQVAKGYKPTLPLAYD